MKKYLLLLVICSLAAQDIKSNHSTEIENFIEVRYFNNSNEESFGNNCKVEAVSNSNNKFYSFAILQNGFLLPSNLDLDLPYQIIISNSFNSNKKFSVKFDSIYFNKYHNANWRFLLFDKKVNSKYLDNFPIDSVEAVYFLSLTSKSLRIRKEFRYVDLLD